MNLLIIVSSTRPNSKGYIVGEYIKQICSKLLNLNNYLINLVNPNDFEIRFDSDKDPKYTEMLKSADKIILIVSEYNHGYPGRLKTLLDSEYELYESKEVLLIGVSSGQIGGARAIENILPILYALKLNIFSKTILIPFVNSKFDEINKKNLDSDLEKYVIDTLKTFFNK